MPQLSGTEKQIAQANDIRNNLIEDYSNFINSDALKFGERMTAEELFLDLYYNGIVESQRDYPKTTKFAEVQREVIKQNPNAKIAEIDTITESVYIDKVRAKADKRYKEYKDQYKRTKEAGTPDKSLMQKAKIARAKVYKTEIKKMLGDSLKHVKNASDWIKEYKHTRYSK